MTWRTTWNDPPPPLRRRPLTDLDEQVLLAGHQVHAVVVEVHTEVDDVSEQLVGGGHALQRRLHAVTHAVLGRKEHRQVLRLLQRLRVGHHLEELRRPGGTTTNRVMITLFCKNDTAMLTFCLYYYDIFVTIMKFFSLSWHLLYYYEIFWYYVLWHLNFWQVWNLVYERQPCLKRPQPPDEATPQPPPHPLGIVPHLRYAE